MAIIPNPQFPITPPIAEEPIKYKIALFQGGLGDRISKDEDSDYNTYFSDTIKNIISYSKKDYSPWIVDNTDDFLTELIDMTYFNVSNSQFTDAGKKNAFTTKISSIYNKAKEHPGKTILVRTYLNTIFGTNINYDSIENQKLKLIYIIDALKQYENVEIYLVGHSQGGLVNLETAIERSDAIDRIISISTPYAPVDFAMMYYPFLICNEFINYASYLLTVNNNYEILSKYRLCVETLASANYFDTLKSKWNALSSRPKLTVITGTAGRVCELAPPIIYTPEACEDDAFDGLVMLTDQKDIEYSQKKNLVDPSVPCYDVWKSAWLNCVTSTNCADSCNGNCTLDTFSIAKALFDELGAVVEELLSSDDWTEEVFSAFTNNPLIRTIMAGLYPEKYDYVCPEGYEKYYRIAISPYNHYHIMYNDETTALLFNLLTEY